MMESPSALDVPIIVLKAAGGRIEGRTALQKIAYFLGARTSLNLGFSPHHYGPYSKLVQVSVDTLVSGEHVTATTVEHGTSSQGWPVRETTYELTLEGEALAERLAAEHPTVIEEATNLVRDLRKWTSTLSAAQLSVAAKVHYMMRGGQTVTPETLVNAASRHGWSLSKYQAEQALEVVQALGFDQ